MRENFHISTFFTRMTRVIVVLTCIVSTAWTQPSAQSVPGAGQTMGDVINQVAAEFAGQVAGGLQTASKTAEELRLGRLLNMTDAVFMDLSQFSLDLGKQLFSVFKTTNNKVYSTKQEEDRRLNIFFQNFMTILFHNELFSRAKVPFSLGVTPFADLTDEEFVRDVCNCLENDEEPRGIPTYKDNLSSVRDVIPPEIDWRKLGAVTPAKEQLTCGSCWTFAATGALEAAQFLATKELRNISMQNLLDCSTTGNCKGGHYAIAFQYAVKNEGINLLNDYPYENAKKSCRFDAQKMKRGQIKKFYKVAEDDEEELKKAVALHGPVAVGINSKGLKLFKSSGVYYDQKTCGKKSQPDHAVLVVGYGTTDKGEDYWIVKNSWGPEWGENGFFKLARNKNNHCHIAHDGIYPVV